MTFSPPPLHRLPDVTIMPYSDAMGGLGIVTQTTPASGAWVTANRAMFYPIGLLDPFTVLKAFVLSGATVGTDSWDIGAYLMTDMATGRLDLIRSTGAVLSAGSANVVQAASAWKIATAMLAAVGSSTDAASYTTSSVTLKAGRLYLIAVENSHGSSASAVSAITGGPTWTSRSTTQYNTNLNRISIWSGVPTVDYTGTLSIAFGGVTQTGAIYSIDEFSGVDTSSSDGVVQQAVGTGNSGTSLATLAAFGSANNATYAAHGHAAASASAPGSGFTEKSDVTAATPAQALCTDWRVDNDTTADATFTSAQWGACAVELKADASPFVIPPNLPGNPNVYMGLVYNGTTATLFRASLVVQYHRLYGGLTLTSSFPLPSSCIPIGMLATSAMPIAGFSRRTLLD
jgi:hypothetical protein